MPRGITGRAREDLPAHDRRRRTRATVRRSEGEVVVILGALNSAPLTVAQALIGRAPGVRKAPAAPPQHGYRLSCAREMSLLGHVSIARAREVSPSLLRPKDFFRLGARLSAPDRQGADDA